jgi:hypothetical protein
MLDAAARDEDTILEFRRRTPETTLIIVGRALRCGELVERSDARSI